MVLLIVDTEIYQDNGITMNSLVAYYIIFIYIYIEKIK
jgi:hypothetical protein